MIPPDRFIPLAEATGVVREVTEYVLQRATTDIARMKAAGKRLSVAVNVSASDLACPGFVQQVKDVITGSGADPSDLTLEVTESAIISSPERAIEVLTALRASGVQLAVCPI
jgi:EAL domain-containing protein (putative c-di-GMP-specific phosphodiesterase class I)